MVGAQLTGGVALTGAFSDADGPYNSATTATRLRRRSLLCTGITIVASGTVSTSSILRTATRGAAALRTEQSLLEFDADLPILRFDLTSFAGCYCAIG